MNSNRLKWFTPTGTQSDFLSNIGKGDIFIGICSAANAIGKTALEINTLGACIFGPSENPWLKQPLFENFPFPHRGRIASTPKNVEEIGAIQTEIKKWWPKGKYQTAKRGKTYDSEYTVDDWVVDILTYEQKVTEYESVTLGIMIFDEPPPLRILYACIARMRKGGVILIFMTPLDTGGEILEEITSKPELTYQGEVIGKVYVQYADVESACKEHGVRGFLEHKHIMTMLNFYDEDEKKARAEGKPVHLTGRIYPTFENKDPYVVDDFVIPEDWTRVNILDPHDAIPFAISWAAIDQTGQIWIYDEFPGEDLEKITTTSMTIPEYARIIREKEGRDLIKLRIADPYFVNKRYSNTGKTIKQELSELGLDFEDGDTSGLELGHQRVREALKYQKAWPVSGVNHPKLHIFKSCRNHWRSMLRYKRKMPKSGEVKDKAVIDETYKHFCDDIRHLLMRDDLVRLQKMSDSEPVIRVSGMMKDIKFLDDEPDSNYGRYNRVSQGVGVE